MIAHNDTACLEIRDHGSSVELSPGETEVNTCLINSLVQGVYIATGETVLDRDIRSVIIGMRGSLGRMDYMDPMQEETGGDRTDYNDIETNTTALMHPSIAIMCWKYGVNLALYRRRKFAKAFELDAQLPWVRLDCTPGVHWTTFMPSDACVADIMANKHKAMAMVEASDALYARTLVDA